MATDYSLDLRANLDTSDVNQKLDALRDSGTTATSQLEEAVKRLDNAVQDLTRSWEKQAEAAADAAKNAEDAAKAGSNSGGEFGGLGGLMKGALSARQMKSIKKLIEQYDMKDGEMSELGTVVTSGLGKAATVAVATKGNPWLTMAGAIWGTVEGFESLKDKANAAAEALQAQADAERKSTRDLMVEKQKEFAHEDALEGMKTASKGDLQAYIDRYKEAKANYRSRIDEGPNGSQTDAEYQQAMASYIEELERLEELSNAAGEELEKRAKAEEKAAKEAEKKAEADKKAAERREKEAEREKKREEAFDQRIESKTSKWSRDDQMREFKAALGGMSAEELMSSREDLTNYISEQKQKRDMYAELAKNMRDEGYLNAAESSETEARDAQAKVDLIDRALEEMTNVKGGGALKDYFEGAMGSEGAKGYDTGQYGSLENAIMKQNLDNTKQIKDGVNEIKGTLKDISNTTTLVKDKLNDNGTVGIYGGP